MRRLFALIACLALFTPAAKALTMDWVWVGDPGNECDRQSQGCFGAVDYTYRIGKYEVTNAQYAEFLNAVAASDPYALYDEGMGSDTRLGGITRSGNSGSYTYTVKAGFENKPVVYVSWSDAVRFANWMHNGMGAGSTESGAYTLLGETPTPSNWATVTRDPGATIWLPSEDEWYKAAYYGGASATWFDYPAGGDLQTGCVAPASDTGNSANCNFAAYDGTSYLTNVGAYSLSDSPYGTLDQGGNVWEWNDTDIGGGSRGLRGGPWRDGPSALAASTRISGDLPDVMGFRIASIPEPATALLVVGGLLGLAVWRPRGSPRGSPPRSS